MEKFILSKEKEKELLDDIQSWNYTRKILFIVNFKTETLLIKQLRNHVLLLWESVMEVDMPTWKVDWFIYQQRTFKFLIWNEIRAKEICDMLWLTYNNWDELYITTKP